MLKSHDRARQRRRDPAQQLRQRLRRANRHRLGVRNVPGCARSHSADANANPEIDLPRTHGVSPLLFKPGYRRGSRSSWCRPAANIRPVRVGRLGSAGAQGCRRTLAMSSHPFYASEGGLRRFGESGLRNREGEGAPAGKRTVYLPSSRLKSGTRKGESRPLPARLQLCQQLKHLQRTHLKVITYPLRSVPWLPRIMLSRVRNMQKLPLYNNIYEALQCSRLLLTTLDRLLLDALVIGRTVVPVGQLVEEELAVN